SAFPRTRFIVAAWYLRSRSGRRSAVAISVPRLGANGARYDPLAQLWSAMVSAIRSSPGSAADGFFSCELSEADPELAAAIDHERKRQQWQIELIASEYIASRAVLEAQGSVLTNKYAEGYPGRRYYGGCEFADAAEILAID